MDISKHNPRLLYFIETIETITNILKKGIDHLEKGNREFFNLSVGLVYFELQKLDDEGAEILEEIDKT